MTSSDSRAVDYNRLIKNVEHLVEAIEGADDVAATVHMVADAVISQFRDQLGLYGGRIYRREGDEFVLQGTFGDAKEVPEGLRVSVDYGPIRSLIKKRTLYMEADDPLLDRALESHLGVQQFVAIEVGDQEYILSFNVAPGYDSELIRRVGENVSIENSVAVSGNTVYFANSGGLVQGWDIEGLKEGEEPLRVFDYWVGDDVDASIVVGGSPE